MPDNADGIVVLELGEVCVRIEGQPDAATLAQVLDRVLRFGLSAGTKVWLAAGTTDMCSGFNGLAAKV